MTKKFALLGCAEAHPADKFAHTDFARGPRAFVCDLDSSAHRQERLLAVRTMVEFAFQRSAPLGLIARMHPNKHQSSGASASRGGDCLCEGGNMAIVSNTENAARLPASV
jgi:hypothetical protein